MDDSEKIVPLHSFEYQVITAQIPEVLAVKVIEAIDEGWQLQGGVAATGVFLHQAMIKGTSR